MEKRPRERSGITSGFGSPEALGCRAQLEAVSEPFLREWPIAVSIREQHRLTYQTRFACGREFDLFNDRS